MSGDALRQRVEQRDRLISQALAAGQELSREVLSALEHRDLDRVRAAIQRNDAHVEALSENLRIYQAELYEQARELSASQARTEAALHRFATLFENMPTPAMLVSHEGAVRECNARAADLLGLRQGSALRFLHRLVDPLDFQSRVRPGLLTARAEGVCALDEILFTGTDGHRFVGELHIAALPELQGEAGQFVCVIVDRSEHFEDLRALRETTEALRESEAFLADSARLARLGGWTYTKHPRALSWSREVRMLLELPGDRPGSFEATLSMCTPPSQPRLVQALDAAALHGVPFEIEIDMVSARGRAMRILAVGHPEGTNGDARVIGVFQDITSQYASRQRIGELTEHLSVATEAGGIGIWDWDLVRHEVFLDDRMCELLGIQPGPAEDLVDLLERCLMPEDAQLMQMALERATTHHEPLSVEVRLAQPGPHAWLHLTGRAHFDKDARAVRLVGCGWDCGAEKEAAGIRLAKEAAEFASRSKSVFLSRMSHELRTPLNAVLGFVQIMQLEAKAGDLTIKPHRLDLIEVAGRHLLALINEVLDVSSIETGLVAVSQDRLDVRTLLHEARALVPPLAEGTQRTLELQVDPGAERVLGDRLRLRQVLINLLSNAVKYNRADGRITVAARRQGTEVAIAVRDEGVGLDAAQIAGLFQPFNRVGAERTQIEGTGMGLFVSKRFVELMHGRIEVDSQPGRGSTFTVVLPAC